MDLRDVALRGKGIPQLGMPPLGNRSAEQTGEGLKVEPKVEARPSVTLV